MEHQMYSQAPIETTPQATPISPSRRTSRKHLGGAVRVCSTIWATRRVTKIPVSASENRRRVLLKASRGNHRPRLAPSDHLEVTPAVLKQWATSRLTAWCRRQIRRGEWRSGWTTTETHVSSIRLCNVYRIRFPSTSWLRRNNTPKSANREAQGVTIAPTPNLYSRCSRATEPIHFQLSNRCQQYGMGTGLDSNAMRTNSWLSISKLF